MNYRSPRWKIKIFSLKINTTQDRDGVRQSRQLQFVNFVDISEERAELVVVFRLNFGKSNKHSKTKRTNNEREFGFYFTFALSLWALHSGKKNIIIEASSRR